MFYDALRLLPYFSENDVQKFDDELARCPPQTGMTFAVAFFISPKSDSFMHQQGAPDQFVLPLCHVPLSRLAALHEFGRVRPSVFKNPNYLPS